MVATERPMILAISLILAEALAQETYIPLNNIILSLFWPVLAENSHTSSINNFMSANHFSVTAHFPMRDTMPPHHVSTCVVFITVRRSSSAETGTLCAGSLLPVILVRSRKVLLRPVIRFGADCSITLLSISEQGSARSSALRREFTTLFP